MDFDYKDRIHLQMFKTEGTRTCYELDSATMVKLHDYYIDFIVNGCVYQIKGFNIKDELEDLIRFFTDEVRAKLDTPDMQTLHIGDITIKSILEDRERYLMIDKYGDYEPQTLALNEHTLNYIIDSFKLFYAIANIDKENR